MSADKINVYATVNTGFDVGVSAQRADTRVSAQTLITEARRAISPMTEEQNSLTICSTKALFRFLQLTNYKTRLVVEA